MSSDVVRWTRIDDKGKSKRCYCAGDREAAAISISRDISNRYDTSSLINSRLSIDQQEQHQQKEQQQQQQDQQKKQQQQQIVSFNEILVIMSRFCCYNRNSTRSSANTIASSSTALMSSRYRRSLFFKFFTFLFVILQVNVFCSSVFVIVAAATDSSWSNRSSSNSSYSNGDNSNSVNGHFTPTWAVHIPNGDENGKADRVARDHGFFNLGKIFDDHYHFHHKAVSKRSLTASHPHQQRLEGDHRVHWSKQQRVKSRQKRDFIRMRPSRTSSQTMSLVSRVQLNDPKWPQMWYLNRGNGLDMNVIPAWEQGITGKGVVVTILDDGLESDHPDLEHNYDPKASYDVNSHDDDPMPHYDMTDSNRHGTRCAGEVAATANNSLCAVGIAFGASVGGVRMLDGDVTDAVEARSLSLNPQHIDIYSASWGPDDDGKTVDGPGELATRAFIEGVTKGRDGKGSIFIWASGNGGRELDNCNCDGYTNSIWTLSISSATEEGHVPWYSEKCSSTLATTYSSGAQNEKQVVTTDLHHSCTTSHTGTSASAPLAAGIVALVLEANRNLTWRDLQHIVVRTAKPGNLKDTTWSKNGVGRRVSHSFGYGLMDAAAMVKVARTWQMVPEQQRCEVNAPHVDQMIPPKRYITLQLTVDHCVGVNFLEHVQAKISLTSQRRGDIQIYLQSPSGTRVTLLTSRLHDVSRSGFSQWPFMSVHTWGEVPRGPWLLEIHNEGRFMAQVTQWDLIFFGTESPAQPDDPVQNGPGRYGQYGGDLENNFLPETMSGQWRDNQQIGESHVDVQRTTSNDETSTACKNYGTDQRCLECAPTTFQFNGRCWSICPDQTYMVPEVPYRVDNPDQPEIQAIRSVPSNSTSPMNKRAAIRPRLQKTCQSCHATCLKCRGPDARDCLQCQPGNALTIISSDESYCDPVASAGKYPGNSLSRATGQHDEPKIGNGFDELFVYRSVLAVVVIGLTVVVVVTMLVKSLRSRWRKKSEYKYDKVAIDATSEETQILRAVNAEDDIEAIHKDYARRKREMPGTSGLADHRRAMMESCTSDSDNY